MERLKVVDDLEKLFCIACKVIFLVLGKGGDDPSLQLVMLRELFWDHDVRAIRYVAFNVKFFKLFYLQFAK